MAAVRYSKAFETQKPQLSFQALLDLQPIGKGSFESYSDKPLKFDYRIQDSDRGGKRP